MKLINKIPCLFFIIILTGCKGNKSGNFPDFKRTMKSAKNLSISSLLIDTVIVHPRAFSGLGQFILEGDTLLFLDKAFSTVSCFDKKGRLIKTLLGYGEGPEEISTGINDYTRTSKYRIIHDNQHISIFDLDWNKLGSSIIHFKPKRSYSKELTHPDANDPGIYEMQYFHDHFIPLDSDLVLFNGETSHPKFNFWMDPEYYKTAKIFAITNTDTKNVVRLIGGYPPVYYKWGTLPVFRFYYTDYTDKKDSLFFVSYEADSLIYAFKDLTKPAFAFGNKGRYMNNNYLRINRMTQYDSLFAKERTRKGYYTFIKYFPKKDLFFRTYRTGITKTIDSSETRLQIYKDFKLIGDVKVGKTFRVIGRDSLGFYADGYYDLNKGILGIYHFILN